MRLFLYYDLFFILRDGLSIPNACSYNCYLLGIARHCWASLGLQLLAAKCVWLEVVSEPEIDWTLVHEIWWRKIEKIKGDRRATLWNGFFLREHSKPRTSSTVVRVQVVQVFVRYARWWACQDSLSCWTGLALANEKEDEGEKVSTC